MRRPSGANHKSQNTFTHNFYGHSLFTMSSDLDYTDLEIQVLLDIVEEVIPEVLMNGKLSHDVTSKTIPDKLSIVWHKFNALATHNKLTGNPNCPPTVH